MYARLQCTNELPESPDPIVALGRLVETISSHPGYAGMSAFRQVDSVRATLLTLWDSAENARRASERTAAQLGPVGMEIDLDEIFEVDDDWRGSDGDQPPRAASLHWFDRPLSQDRLDAARFAGRERIAPMMAEFPGTVRALSLWQPTTRQLAVAVFATSLEALEAGGRAVLSMELLPDEDPALLSGPDQYTVNTVDAYAGAPEGAIS
jgi:hypothetical protein